MRLRLGARCLPWLCTAALLAQGGRPPGPGMQQFQSRSGAFHIDVPAGWQQVTPDQTRALRDFVPELPAELHRTRPRDPLDVYGLEYYLAPAAAWLAGGFDGVYLYVAEQGNEWRLEGDLATAISRVWSERADRDGMRHEITEVRRQQVGSDGYEVVQCLRRSVPAAGGRALQSLDVYAPTGGRQVSLAFRCFAEDFPAQLPRFRQMLSTLTLARKARGAVTLGDRLTMPLVTGALVCILLLVLHRRTRRAV